MFLAGRVGRGWRVFLVQEGQVAEDRAREEGVFGRTRSAWPEEVARWCDAQSLKRCVLQVGRGRWRELPVQRAIDLYRGPFSYDGRSYVWDADGHMVADDMRTNEDGTVTCCVRGWGRIGYLDDADALFDAVRVHIDRAIAGLRTTGDEHRDGEAVASALTKYWETQDERSVA